MIGKSLSGLFGPRSRWIMVSLTLVAVLSAGWWDASAALAADTGYRDLYFSSTGVTHPTEEKSQSKLWYNDGSWWGILFNRSTKKHQIYRYDWASHAWNDTGTVVDDRPTSKADALSDGNKLYVANAGWDSTKSSHAARISRYSYDAATKRYSRDTGFPVTITNSGMEEILIAKDSTGKLWVTYTKNSKVYVNHTLSSDLEWGTPFVLPVGNTDVSSDDISSIIAFGNQIGVMWSNQLDGAFYFATHNDGNADDTWQVSTALQGPGMADDHINLKADSNGKVYAAVKTSLNDVPNQDPNTPLQLLLVRDQSGSWSSHVFGRVSDKHTKPLVLIDEEHRAIHMLATSPCCNGGRIYYKQTSMDNISFPEGMGTPFIQSSTDLNINDPTSTKQNLNGNTGLLVEASDGVSGFYVHNRMNLGAVDSTAPVTQPPTQSLGAGATLSATTVPVKVTWSATDSQSGITEYQLQQSVNGGAYSKVSLSSLAATSTTRSLSPSNTYQFRARAIDGAGNWSEWGYGPVFTVAVHQETGGAISYGGAWTQQNSTQSSGGALKYTQIKGANARITFTGRNVAWVSTKDKDRGKAEVWLDGAKVQTIDLYSSTAKSSNMVFTKEWPTSDSHTLEVRVLGTKNASSTGTRVDLDAFVVLHSDKTAPMVDTVTPQDGANGVPSTANVEATFSEAMDSSTLNGSTFTLTKQGDGGGPVAATVSYDPATRKATLDPDSYLASDAPYTATVKSGSGGAKDAAGNALAADKTWSFSTPDTTPPETTIEFGPTGTVNSAAASFGLSSSEASPAFQCSLDGAPFEGCTSPKAYADLTDGSHTFEVRATDAAGNTDPTPATRTWMVDTTAPKVVDVVPQEGTTGVAPDANLEANFAEAMDPFTIGEATFTLTREGGEAPVAATVNYDVAVIKASLDPTESLEAGAVYKATIKGGTDGVKDTAGNPLETDVIWLFST